MVTEAHSLLFMILVNLTSVGGDGTTKHRIIDTTITFTELSAVINSEILLNNCLSRGKLSKILQYRKITSKDTDLSTWEEWAMKG